jgi:tetratricopeptide (TPR) repeat protein
VSKSEFKAQSAVEAINEVAGNCCPICLEMPMASPLMLPCGHAFCRLCINEWRESCETELFSGTEPHSTAAFLQGMETFTDPTKDKASTMAELQVVDGSTAASHCPTCRTSLSATSKHFCQVANTCILICEQCVPIDQHKLREAYERAEGLYEKALRQDPKDRATYVTYVRMLQKTEQVDKANALYERMLRADPDFVDGLFFYGQFLYDQGNHHAALAKFKRVVKLAPNDAEAWHEYARISYDMLRTDDAITFYRRALKADPTRSSSMTNLGYLLQKTKSMTCPEAERLFCQAIKINPNEVDAMANLATLLITHNEAKDNTQSEVSQEDQPGAFLTKAKQLLASALKINPDHINSMGSLALLLYRSVSPKDLLEAEQLFKRILTLNPDDHRTLENYALLAIKMGNNKWASVLRKKGRKCQVRCAGDLVSDVISAGDQLLAKSLFGESPPSHLSADDLADIGQMARDHFGKS